MIILGVDPGIATVGYGVVELVGNKYRVIDYGAILTPSDQLFPDRLKSVYNQLNDIIIRYRPDELAIEELFFNKNVKTAIKVGHARGVEILAAVNHDLEVYEYTPLQVKQAVVGYGRAEKRQVQEMVKILLNLDKIPKPDDVADALAVAICHGSSLKFKESFKMR
ncbi:crossover junction endodeoxyribonuclease RuvC [Gudongella sp. SC589]|jgi:crossover junction endodeoxyribonuclease RuvC|uniref:crossover junction endodeoxyribonuclease RuvC n=1 Tax=Gudongella sp. SC589 TaxID=3385990 RepID=UPI003904B7ED